MPCIYLCLCHAHSCLCSSFCVPMFMHCISLLFRVLLSVICCLSVCLSACLSVCLSVSLSVYLSVLSICLSTCLCPHVCLSVCLSVYSSVCLSLSACLLICLSVCLSVCLSARIHVHSLYLFPSTLMFPVFLTGHYGIAGRNTSCLVYTTFSNQILVYTNISLPSIPSTNMLLALHSEVCCVSDTICNK